MRVISDLRDVKKDSNIFVEVHSPDESTAGGLSTTGGREQPDFSRRFGRFGGILAV